MPTIQPPGGAVDWPRNEGVLGVVGVAPWATLDFLQAFYERVKAAKDWHYPRVIADINTKLPSRGRHLELGETDPSPLIAQTIDELAAQGATVVVVPCNTAHLLYPRWAGRAPVVVPHIVEATVARVQRAGATRVAAFTSASLRRHGLFEAHLRDAGLQPVDVGDSLAALVSAAIDEVKREARITPATQAAIDLGLQGLREAGVDGLVLGCTELAALQPAARAAGLVVAESNAALAEAALALIQPHAWPLPA